MGKKNNLSIYHIAVSDGYWMETKTDISLKKLSIQNSIPVSSSTSIIKTLRSRQIKTTQIIGGDP